MSRVAWLYLVVLVLLLALPACAPKRGPQGLTGPQGVPSGGCSVLQTEEGALLSCSDGTHAFIENGKECERRK
jgi:hypothetical protein